MKIVKMYFQNKRGIALATLITMILVLVFILILLAAIVVIGNFTKDSWSTSMCRITLWTNAYVQLPVIHKEFVPIVCKSKPPHVITLDDVNKGSTDVDAIGYSIMKLVAEDEVATHYKVLGNSPDIEVFPKKDGIYCIFDRKITFDKKLQEYNGGKGVVTKGYLTYLMNSKMNDGKTTYAEYLYGYKPSSQKTTFADEMAQGIQKQAGGTSFTVPDVQQLMKYDTVIDTSKEYYLIHYAIKGKKNLGYVLWNDVTNEQIGKATTAAIVGTVIGVALLGPIGLLAGPLILAGDVAWYTYAASDYKIRFTALVPTTDVGFLRCTKIYGDDYGG